MVFPKVTHPGSDGTHAVYTLSSGSHRSIT
jgi:hypothetical protein